MISEENVAQGSTIISIYKAAHFGRATASRET